MSKIHVLETNGKRISTVLHYDMPAGNNSAGKSWQSCWVNAGNAVTTLPEGTGAGQISAAEKASVEAGSVVEIAATLGIDGTPTLPELNATADTAIAGHQAEMALAFKWYGLEEG